eukprot:Clim_evm6s46 gene=Clim_evmTU6s46
MDEKDQVGQDAQEQDVGDDFQKMAEDCPGAKSTLFNELVLLFEEIRRVKKTGKSKLLMKFFNEWRAHKDLNLFPVLRMLIPQHERHRANYGLKVLKLGQYFVEVLAIPKDSVDARKLTNYRDPSNTMAGNFADALYEVSEPRIRRQPTLTIYEVQQLLDELAKGGVEHNPKMQKATLRKFASRCTPKELQWLVRIIVKDIKIGMTERSILSAFHPEALEYFNRSSSLLKVARHLQDPNASLQSVDVKPFEPVRAMAGEKFTDWNMVDQLLSNYSEVVAEHKLDGVRLQMHLRNDGKCQYFSRSGKEYSEHLGESREIAGSYTQAMLSGGLHDSVEDCILDGEVLVFDHENQVMRTKVHEEVFLLGKKSIEAGRLGSKTVCYIVFDVLYLNGTHLCNLALKNRRQLLEKIINPINGILDIVDQFPVHTRDDVISHLTSAMDLRQEGIMLKPLEAPYLPGQRKLWVKIKPDYVNEISETLECLVVGGYYGQGRRRNRIAYFLLAVRVDGHADASSTQEEAMPVFKTLTRVGSGYTMATLDRLHVMLQDKWRPWPGWNQVPWLQTVGRTAKAQDNPEVYIEPQDSVVVEIRAAEFQSSVKYATGIDLRFPRIVRFREDLSYTTCLDEATLQQILAHSDRLNKQRLQELDRRRTGGIGGRDKSRRPTKRRKVAKSRHILTRGINTRGIEVSGQLFEGLEVLVFNAFFDDDLDGDGALGGTKQKLVAGRRQQDRKPEIETKIVENGGEITQHATDRTDFAIASKPKVTVKNYISAGAKFDILYPSYILDCLSAGEVLPLQSKHVFWASPEGRAKSALRAVDLYGDSYTADADVDSLREALSLSRQKRAVLGGPVQVKGSGDIDFGEGFHAMAEALVPDLCREMNGTGPFLFDGVTAVVQEPQASTTEAGRCLQKAQKRLIIAMLRAYGASVSSNMNDSVTHVVIVPSIVGALDQVNAKAVTSVHHTSGHQGIPVFRRCVNMSWVLHSVEHNHRADEDCYMATLPETG